MITLSWYLNIFIIFITSFYFPTQVAPNDEAALPCHTFLKTSLSVVQLVACSHTHPVIGWHILSLPLIGWHSCQLSVSIPALPPAQASTLHMLSSYIHVLFDRQAQIFPHISYQKSKVWNMIFKTTCIADMWSMFDDDVQYLPTCQLVPRPFWKTLLVFSQWTFCKQKQKNKTLNKILEVLHFVSKWNK